MRGHAALESLAVSKRPLREFQKISVRLLVSRLVTWNHRNQRNHRKDQSIFRSQEHSRSPEKSIQDRPKIVPERCLGDTRGLPGASRGPVRACVQAELKMYKKLKASGRHPRCPGRPPGIQRDPKNRQNINFLVEKGIPNAESLSICMHRAVFRAFGTISLRFFMENR